jgi:hypothetical protein
MSPQTLAHVATPTSREAGYRDGEFAAVEGMNYGRLIARAEMAEAHDLGYALGLLAGYQAGLNAMAA